MKQLYITVQNGKLALKEPESELMIGTPPRHEADHHEWKPSHLDAICVEEFIVKAATLSAIPPAPDSRRRRRTLRSARRFTNQYQLSNDNGILTLKKRVLSFEKVLFLGVQKKTIQQPVNFNNNPSLLRLPAELRLPIYRHLLLRAARYPIFRGVHDFHIQIGDWRMERYAGELWPEILATCRLIHREGTPILYGENMFERVFSWPSKRLFSSIPLPRSLTSKLTKERISCISAVWLAEKPDIWLDDQRELKVFQDFPGLQQIEFSTSCWALSPQAHEGERILLEDCLKSVDRKSKPLRRCSFYLRLPWDTDWKVWSRGEAKGFGPHLKLKANVEYIMKVNSLFPHQKITWSFETSFSEYSGPEGYVNFIIEDARSGEEGSRKPDIKCTVGVDGIDSHTSMEDPV
ncbi:unnamed protein product [Clonostachys chloroleuca]|uniref:Uncharacterized protein n=1 Tax=Clonostachys chloroleuca TaxID=1926264 RepID=A0AA35PT91_9HYPO|nr:unnamed protein product [Clonostachys chloroleuca]